MQLMSLTGKGAALAFILYFGSLFSAFSQDNAPLSRYGLGEIVPPANILNRSMGNVSAAYSDFQSINFINPASYRRFGTQRAILDIGLDANNRTLRNNLGSKYTSANVLIPYVAAGFQIKPEKSKTDWGVAFGLRPLTKVSYSIQSSGRINAGDSVINFYQGNGGLYQAFAGTAIGIKNFSIGVNGGYRFGSKDYSSTVTLINDTVPDRYIQGQKKVKNTFNGAFAEVGLQYEFVLHKDTNSVSSLHVGAYGTLQTKMRGTRDELLETAVVNSGGTDIKLDSVLELKDQKGDILYPATYGFGLMYDYIGKSKVSVGADLVLQNWASYRYYNTADLLQNSWTVNVGGMYLPDITGRSKSFWSQVMYRAGFHYGLEPFTVAGDLKGYGITFGMGLPIKKYSYAEINRNNVVNVGLEFGQRGNKTAPIRENYYRFTLGFSLSDIWFIKRRYD
jgi:hypothetical protein